ncbi:beta-lactamase-like protein [Apiospora saccharicola]
MSPTPNALVELDSLLIQTIVNDEIDQISPSPHPGGATRELRMDTLCCGAHGLSLLITAIKAGHPRGRSLLFDAGPEGEVWERNARRLGLDLGKIEHVVLSHWHRDHSGGLVSAVKMISEAAATKSKPDTERSTTPVVVDVHPNRPAFRGVMIPTTQEPISLQADPTVQELQDAGAAVRRESEAYTVLDDMFLVSGAIPRETDYEGGIRGGITFNEASGKWERDELILDERFVMCRLKGKGLVVFTGCSHAGVVNVSRHAVRLGSSDGRVPLYKVVGGYHLADARAEKMDQSLRDLKALKPEILMPGHCTGWRFKIII